jgi:hypothetical protein
MYMAELPTAWVGRLRLNRLAQLCKLIDGIGQGCNRLLLVSHL